MGLLSAHANVVTHGTYNCKFWNCRNVGSGKISKRGPNKYSAGDRRRLKFDYVSRFTPPTPPDLDVQNNSSLRM